MINKLYILSLLLFGVAIISFESNNFHVIVDELDEYEFQGDNVLFLKDSTKSLELKDVKNASFKPFVGAFLNDDPSSIFWLKFPLISKSSSERKWVLEFLDGHQEKIDVYFFRKDQLIAHETTGIKVKGHNDQYSHKNHVVDVPLGDVDRLDVFVKYESGRVGSMIFKLRSNAEFSSYGFKEYYILGIYYGILLLICLLNIIMFLFLKEKIYITYILYVVAWMFSSLNEDGIGQHLYWTNHFWFDSFIFQFIQPILILSYVWYSVQFFSRGKIKVSDFKFIIYTTALYLVVYSFEVILGTKFSITTWLMFIPLVKILLNAFNAYKSGYTPAQFFILGNVFIIFGLFVRFLQDAYVIKFVSYYSIPAIMAVYSRNIGMVLEIITLMVALGDRFRFFKEENELQQRELMNGFKEREVLQEKLILNLKEKEELNEKVNKELENKVRERTVELEKKSSELADLNEELQAQSEQINEMNRILDLDNFKLKKKVDEVNSSRVYFKKVSYEEFAKLYPNKLSVLRFLNDNKWKTGYKCRKCGNEKYCEGNSKYSRRCTKCRYDESITAFTIFHKCKFPLEYALYIVSKTIRHGKNADVQEIADELGLRKNTVKNFKDKVIRSIDHNKIVNKDQDDTLVAVTLDPPVEG